MRTLELFAGTCSFSNVAYGRGHETMTSDIEPGFDTDYCVDIMEFDASLVGPVDVIWASPPCETFSVASISHNWTGGVGAYIPKNARAQAGIDRVLKTIEIIEKLEPRFWFIENPRGVLRKMPFMQDFVRHTVSYCQYGDTRMKPTDIWSNVAWYVRPMCKNGDPCHEAAPRGAKTGTQGIKGYRDRSVVPRNLCESLIEQCEVSGRSRDWSKGGDTHE